MWPGRRSLFKPCEQPPEFFPPVLMTAANLYKRAGIVREDASGDGQSERKIRKPGRRRWGGGRLRSGGRAVCAAAHAVARPPPDLGRAAPEPAQDGPPAR